MALLELVRKAELEDDVDFLREGVRLMAQQLMEAEVTQYVGADKFKRTAASNCGSRVLATAATTQTQRCSSRRRWRQSGRPT